MFLPLDHGLLNINTSLQSRKRCRQDPAVAQSPHQLGAVRGAQGPRPLSADSSLKGLYSSSGVEIVTISIHPFSCFLGKGLQAPHDCREKGSFFFPRHSMSAPLTLLRDAFETPFPSQTASVLKASKVQFVADCSCSSG